LSTTAARTATAKGGQRPPLHPTTDAVCTSPDFLAFLKKVARRYRGELHVILDNYATHKTPAVQAWLAAHPRVQFHFTPTGASWLNMIEAWFSVLTRQSIRRGSFDTVRALIRHINAYLDRWNNNAVVNMTSNTEH
jgi:transposase